MNEYAKSRENLLQAVNLNDANPSYYHNLAVCFLNLDEPEEAVPYVDKAIALYGDNKYWKADSCFLKGSIMLNLSNYQLAIESFERGKGFAPGEYKYIDRLLELYLYTEDIVKAEENAILFFNLYPTNPTVSSMILDYYVKYNKAEHIIDLFRNLIEIHKENDEAVGNLCFYSAIAFDYIQEYQKALNMIEESRRKFKTVFDDDHAVFTELSRMETQIEDKL